MSITLITGVPGSGKTLKAVWDHLRPMVGHVDHAQNDRGETIDIPAIVYTNINSLQVDHELIEGGGSWASKAGDWTYEGNPEGLRMWHKWAKPGAKIFFDEFQKFWPPRPNGAPVPPDIQALDTHRHMGVDFVLITQNCRNVDRHILGLVDRHLHVRRVANMPLAVVYEWDHASVSLNYKNSMSKSPWRYPKQAYKLYKSAELHTKQARKMPGLVWFILAGLAGAAYAGPTLYNRLQDRVHGGGQSKNVTSQGIGSGSTASYVKDGMQVTVETVKEPSIQPVAPLPMSDASVPVLAPKTVVLAGCIVVRNRCGCLGSDGFSIKVESSVCLEKVGVSDLPPAVPVEPLPRSSSSDSYAFAFRSR